MAKIILIVDDSAHCAETLQIALESIRDFEVQIASSGHAALRALTAANGDVAAVITDLQMPQMSGLDLIERMKANPGLSHVPVLVISGDSDPRLPDRALSLGAQAFFIKPYSPAEVRRKLEELLT